MPKISLIYKKKIFNFEVEGKAPLWDELDTLHLQLPHGCLAGSCGACRIYVKEGVNHLSEMGFVERDTVQSIEKSFREEHNKEPDYQIRLSCRLKVLGDASFETIEK